MGYLEERLARKQGIAPPLEFKKKPKPMKKISDKKATEVANKKIQLGGDESLKEKWFKARRKEMVGVCQCGCCEPSSKKDDAHFRSSICHIFPQRLFPSIQYHRLNWVERKLWATQRTGACHTNMDNRSMDLWPNFADWDDIKEKFFQLSPLLTDEERKLKFYTHISKLVYAR